MRDARSTLKPGGHFILKDWKLIKNIGHPLCEFSDRVLAGDEMRFGREPYFRSLVEKTVGRNLVRDDLRIWRWPNNLLMRCQGVAS